MYGFLINIINILKIENGVVNEYGDAIFEVVFTALVYKAVKDEIVDAIVSDVTSVGINCKIGSFIIFVPHTKIPKDYQFSSQN